MSPAGGSSAKGGGSSMSTGGSAKGGGSSMSTGGMAAGGSTTMGSGGAMKDCSANVAKGTGPLIDDFEDNDLGTSPNEGRSGWWTQVRSDSSMPGPTPSILLESSNRFMRVSGTSIANAGNYPWALLKVDFKGIGDEMVARSCLYDASAYRGLRFRARGVRVRVALEMDLNIPVANTYGAPGACTAMLEADCYDRHSVVTLLTSAFAPYQVLWGDLVQQGFGAWHPVFSPARLVGLYFEVVPNADGSISAYQFDIDDVEFIQ
jgi:hypothetical protein